MKTLNGHLVLSSFWIVWLLYLEIEKMLFFFFKRNIHLLKDAKKIFHGNAEWFANCVNENITLRRHVRYSSWILPLCGWLNVILMQCIFLLILRCERGLAVAFGSQVVFVYIADDALLLLFDLVVFVIVDPLSLLLSLMYVNAATY